MFEGRASQLTLALVGVDIWAADVGFDVREPVMDVIDTVIQFQSAAGVGHVLVWRLRFPGPGW